MDGNKRELFKKIIQTEPKYDRTRLSSSAIDLLKQLLNKDPSERIKPNEIPLHAWFTGLDFGKIKVLGVKPPISPNIVRILIKIAVRGRCF